MRWGIDLGGTKTEVVVIRNAHAPDVIYRKRIPTESARGYDHILSNIMRLIELVRSETGLAPQRIGMGTPGALDPISGMIKNSNTSCLNGRPLLEDITRRTGLPFRLANDANCFALAETLFGAAKQQCPDARVIFGVIMGTGVGGGIVLDKKPLIGLQGLGGEWGHTFLDDSGGDCYCGNRGCVEMLISGPALESFYSRRSGRSKRLAEIVDAARLGEDMVAVETVNRLMHFFGKGIANVINILDPEVIVLGGGLGNIDLLYDHGVNMARKYVFNNRLETRFLRPLLGDSAGVFGAALLWES